MSTQHRFLEDLQGSQFRSLCLGISSIHRVIKNYLTCRIVLKIHKVGGRWGDKMRRYEGLALHGSILMFSLTRVSCAAMGGEMLL